MHLLERCSPAVVSLSSGLRFGPLSVCASAQIVPRMYATVQNPLPRRVILETVKRPANAIVHDAYVLTDYRSAGYSNGWFSGSNEEVKQMKKFENYSRFLTWFMALLLSALVSGCGGGGGKDPILGVGGTVNPTTEAAPRVTAVSPLANATGVPTNTKIITAAFSKAMNSATLTTASFTLTCPGYVAGGPFTVTYLAAGNVATLTLPAAPDLPPTTLCTATVTTAARDTTGIALASNFVWTFTTGVTPDTSRPRVTLTVPATTIPGPTAMPTNTAITAVFTEDMNPDTITAAGTFTVTCAAPCVSPAGTVSYAVGSRTATFTPTAVLIASATYTATITTAATDLAGNQLAGNQAALPAASNYVWTFTTGLAPDTTRPRVTLTVPATTIPGPTAGVPTNSAITAVFTEDMAPATILPSFTVTCAAPCVSPAGTVSYAVGSRTATFTPTAVLIASATYTATITTAATDLAGNQLAGNQAALPAASNYIWTFTTAAAVPAANVSVLSTNPAASAPAVCPTASINATFTVPSGVRMDPLTVNAASFTVTGPGATSVTASSVVIDVPTGRIATFTPLNPLPFGDYTATITSGATGVKDLAIPANTMLAPDYSWSFTVVSCVVPPPPPVSHLGSASAFGIMGWSAITNTGAATIINGDVSLEPGTSNGLLPVQVNGTIHINDAISHQANLDLLVAYNYYKGLAPGTTVPGGTDLGAFGTTPGILPPGTYTSGSTMLVSTPLVLDAQGDANAVWVFQIGSSLTTNVGAPGGNISFRDGIGNPNNVFWVPTAAATIGVGTTFIGTIVAGGSATGQTGATINGRILAGALGSGTVALDTNTVNVPAP